MEKLKTVCRGKVCNTCKLLNEEGCDKDQCQRIISNFCNREYIFGSNPRGRISSHHMFQDVCSENSSGQYDNANPVTVIVGSEAGESCEVSMGDLNLKVEELEKNNNELRKRLEEAIEEKNNAYCKLEVISVANESRITEMHCVIAELSKKLRLKQEATIVEESEQEGSELSYQCESAHSSDQGEDSLGNTKYRNDVSTEDAANVGAQVPAGSNTQVEVLQEEILHLKAQIAFLQSQIANESGSSPDVCRETDNNEMLQDTAIDLNYDEINAKANCESWNMLGNQFYGKDVLEDKHILTKANINQIDKLQLNVSMPKVAERVKLRRTLEDQASAASENLSNDVNPVDIVENLMSTIIQSKNLIENEIEPSELKFDADKLQRQVERLKARNSVLTLTLNECKRHCEHLYLLCGKYESNAIALQAALSCSDRAIEAYDVMLALLESKLALMKDKSPSAQESRRAVEAVARHLLEHLECERSFNESSLGPWQNTVCISNSQVIEPWTTEDDNRLRYHVSKLKCRRSTIQNTVVTFESPFYSEPESEKSFSEINKDVLHENTHLDLEMAVLMQELLSLREDVIESRQKTERSEHDKLVAFEKVRLLQAALSKLQAHLTEPEVFVDLATKNRTSFSEVDHAAVVERQLIEALSRESQLKNRIQSLIGSASAMKKISDEQYTTIQNNLSELQKVNLSLSRSLDICKKKYQARIKKLEQKIVELTKINEQQCPGNIPETIL